MILRSDRDRIGVKFHARWLRAPLAFLVVLTLVVLLLPLAEAKKDGRKISNSGSLKRGGVRLHSRPEWTRRRAKNSECRLGGTGRYALDTTWSPDLGPPFGVWSCVKCKCVSVTKKRRIVAKVICRNIKNECPIAKCANPILPTGACCKRCPQQNEVFQEDHLIQKQEAPSEDFSAKDFAVLLNGRTSQSPLTTHHLATGRIFLRRGTLHFSFVLESGTPTPSNIQFLDENGSILEELEAQPTPYEVNNGRVCGSWTRVPRKYRAILLDEKMWVAFQSDGDDDAISGRIARYKGVETEVFSSLLSPKRDNNETLQGGGTAIISVSAPSDSLHISLIFNGVFASMGTKGAPLMVELVPARALEPVEERVVLEKVYSDLNQAEILTTLGNTSLRLLTRGKVSMKVWSPDAPHLALEGLIIARATCNVYSSLLTSKPLDKDARYGAGWALLSVSNEGDFQYQIRVEDLPSPVLQVTFHHQTRRKTRQVEDLTDFYKDGWANGTFTKPTYRDLDMLLRGRLLAMVTLTNGQVLQGEFQSISVTEALRTAQPSLLRNPSSWVAATAWVAVDSACVMHYDIYIGGDDPSGNRDPTWSLQLREEDITWDPRLDLTNVTLERIVTGREVSAHTIVLSKISLTRLSKDISYLDVTISRGGGDFEDGVVLTGKVKGTVVPLLCTLEYHLPSSSSPAEKCSGPVCVLREKEQEKSVSTKCIDNEVNKIKKVYEDGHTWQSPVNPCQRCMCTLGQIRCQDELCPKPSCNDPITLPGACCPSCPVVSGSISEQSCEMANNFRPIGSLWHPFLAPNGFDRCVTCYCNVSETMTPKVECTKPDCPKLPCKEMEAQIVEGSCCRKCPPTTTPPTFKDQAENQDDRKERILRNGGCLERQIFLPQVFARKNGETWLAMRRKRKCFYCTCKEGKIRCYPEKCKDCNKRRSCPSRKDFEENPRKSKNRNHSFRDANKKRRKKDRKKQKKERKNKHPKKYFATKLLEE